MIQGDSASAEQRRRFQIETETAENEVQAERTANAQLQVAQLATEMAELQARTSIADAAPRPASAINTATHNSNEPAQ